MESILTITFIKILKYKITFIKILKYLRSWIKCKYLRKFSRGCNSTVHNVSNFHRMDRQRDLSLLRYWNQRKYVLV